MDMNMYLIRHTAPEVAPGTCYGQTDLPLKGSFARELAMLKQHIPINEIVQAYTSPLSRCRQLAKALFENEKLHTEPALMEINCGGWEGQHWDLLPDQEIAPWLANRMEHPFPGGESYQYLYERVKKCFAAIAGNHGSDGVAIVTHGGVIRSILSYLTHTPLEQSFKAFSLHYGGVIHLSKKDNVYNWKILYNQDPGVAEQHLPSRCL